MVNLRKREKRGRRGMGVGGVRRGKAVCAVSYLGSREGRQGGRSGSKEWGHWNLLVSSADFEVKSCSSLLFILLCKLER